MGSSAIKDMPGTPVIDICFILKEHPIPEDKKEKLKEKGYTCLGKAPHDDGDEWFHGGDAEKGQLGRCVFHTVP